MRSSSLTSIFAFSTTLLAPLATAARIPVKAPLGSLAKLPAEDIRKAMELEGERLLMEHEKQETNVIKHVRHITATGWNGLAGEAAGPYYRGIRVYYNGCEECDGIHELTLIDKTVNENNHTYYATYCHSRTQLGIDLGAAIASTSVAWDGNLKDLRLFYFTTDGYLRDAYWYQGGPDHWTYNTGLNELATNVNKTMLAATSSVIGGVPNYSVYVVKPESGITEYSRTGGNGQPWKTRDFTLGNTKDIVGISATSSSVGGVLIKGVYVMYASGTILGQISEGTKIINTTTSDPESSYSSMVALSISSEQQTRIGPRLFVQPLNASYVDELYTSFPASNATSDAGYNFRNWTSHTITKGAQMSTKLAAGFMPGPHQGWLDVFYIDNLGDLRHSFRNPNGIWKSPEEPVKVINWKEVPTSTGGH